MSEIFNALQRSESNGRKKDTLGPLRALDLLRQAEELAQSEWDHAAGIAPPRSEEVAELETLLQRGALESHTPLDYGLAQSAASSATVRAHVTDPGQFRTISASASPDSSLVSVADADSPAAEAFRLLGVRLRNLRETRSLQRVLVTSTVPREGKSMVTGNLACTLAGSGRTRTLLLEGDVRRPTQSKVFGLKESPGLCEWLQSTSSLSDSVYRLDPFGFWIMPAGSCSSNPLELLQPGRLTVLMSQLSEWFDLILIDSPPVLPLADTSMWMKFADGILLVTRQGVTEKLPLQRGLEAIDPQKMIGAIINSSKNLPHTDYYYSLQAPAELADKS